MLKFKKAILFGFLGNILSFAWAHHYPDEWWVKVPDDQKFYWEISPHQAKKDVEVILSKRTELGAFSNFHAVDIDFDGETYGSIEGFWQMMYYPDPADKKDPRHQIKGYPYTREQVKRLASFKAKDAGKVAKQLAGAHGIKWISYKGRRFNHKDFAEGSKFHLGLIEAISWQKINQHPKIKKLLLQTGDLILLPDHQQKGVVPPSYHYFKIYMQIRAKLKASGP